MGMLFSSMKILNASEISGEIMWNSPKIDLQVLQHSLPLFRTERLNIEGFHRNICRILSNTQNTGVERDFEAEGPIVTCHLWLMNNVSKTFKTWGFLTKSSRNKGPIVWNMLSCMNSETLRAFSLEWKKRFERIYGYLHLQSIISGISKLIYIYIHKLILQAPWWQLVLYYIYSSDSLCLVSKAPPDDAGRTHRVCIDDNGDQGSLSTFQKRNKSMIFWLWEATKHPSSSSWLPASFKKENHVRVRERHRNTVYRLIYESSLHLW